MTYRWVSLLTILPLCSLLACQACQTCQVGDDATPADFDGLLTSLGNLSSQERQEQIADYIAAFGPTPLVEGEQAIFVAQGEPSDPPRIVGDLNGWGRNDEGPIESAGSMTPIEGTDWHYLRKDFQQDARIEYAIVYGDAEHVDPHNPATTLGFQDPVSELAMPAYERPPEFLEDPSVPKGLVSENVFKSRILNNERKVFVYLPNGYDESERRYPSLYIGDGGGYVERGIPRLLDYTIAKGICRPLIAVFVDPVVRREEYGMHEGYRRFVTEELVPFIDKNYRTLTEPKERAVMGSSRGGLAAADLAYSHPEIFGNAAALSPATRPTNFNEIIASNPPKPVRFFLIVGHYDVRWGRDGLAPRDALTEAGYDFAYLEIPEGHSIDAWRARVDDVVADFFPLED